MSYEGRRFYLPLPPATKALFWINVAVFVLNALLFGRLSGAHGLGEPGWFAFRWSGLFDGYGLGLLRVVTYQFTHSFGDVMHVLMNMLALWVFGPLAESRLGRLGTYRLYLWGGFVGALGHLAVGALQGQAAGPLVGASGACYALLVYAACTAPQTSIVFMIVQLPLWLLATILCGIGAYATFVELAAGAGGHVAHSAHLGGALVGFVAHRLGWFVDHGAAAGLDPWRGLVARWRARRAGQQAARAAERELQLDAVLAKVKAQGLGSLSTTERRFLERLSQDTRNGR